MTDASPATPKNDDIFLSYPSADRDSATALKTALEALGLRVPSAESPETLAKLRATRPVESSK